MVPIFPSVHTVQCSGSRDENRTEEEDKKRRGNKDGTVRVRSRTGAVNMIIDHIENQWTLIVLWCVIYRLEKCCNLFPEYWSIGIVREAFNQCNSPSSLSENAELRKVVVECRVPSDCSGGGLSASPHTGASGSAGTGRGQGLEGTWIRSRKSQELYKNLEK